MLVANPPYGIRLDEQAHLAAFYPQLGDALRITIGEEAHMRAIAQVLRDLVTA